jgi:hypothetical protein
MRDRTRAAGPFLAIGIAFLALGATGRRPFLALGLTFIIIAIIRARRP